MSSVPWVRYPKLQFFKNGSTWRVKHEDVSWPITLYARDIYYGTGRLLATLTIDRQDAGSEKPTRILTGNIDLLTAAQRTRFAKEASDRLQRTNAKGDFTVPITSMIDAMLERLQESKYEIDAIPLNEVEIPADLTPQYVVWPIVPVSRPGMLVASSGSGKSTLAAMIGLSVITGEELLPGIEPRNPGPVIYIGQEEDAAQMRVRVEMMMRGHEIKADLGRYLFMKLRGSSLIDSAEMIAEKADEIKASMVIIDSAQATWGTEGDAIRDYATRWFNAVDSLATPTLIIEHPNLFGTKKDDGSGMAAGTSVKRDRSGHVWGVKSVEIPAADGMPYRYHVTLKDAKRNYVARQPDIIYEVLINGHQWTKFVPAEVLTAESIVDASRLFAALASIMRGPDELHDEGWTAAELAQRMKAKDDRRIRTELGLDIWRLSPWDADVEVKMRKVIGSGTKGDPARYLLETRPKIDYLFPTEEVEGLLN